MTLVSTLIQLTTCLVYHIAFWMPMFCSILAINFNILLENSHLTSRATDCELGRIMKMTINLAIMLIVGIIRTKSCRTNTACKVIGMELFVKSNDIRSS